MKSLIVLAIAAFISGSVLANEPTAAEGTPSEPTAAEQHPTDAAGQKVAKKIKKTKKTTKSDGKNTTTTEQSTQTETHPAGH